MPDLNKEALAIWESLKPAIDKEIERKTAGMVQRRKVVVSTAPSSATGLVGVHEPFAPEFFVPFRSEVSEAVPGDPIWIEFAYGANNAVAIGMASLIDDDDSGGGRSVSATLSSSGWYRVMNFDNTNAGYQQGATGAEIVFHITRRRINAGEETHEVKMLCLYNDVKFVDEVSATYPSYQRIDKIRYTYDSDGAHVDIHVNNTAPAVCVDFEVYCEPDRQSMYTAASLESVADAPAGETVLTTHTFAATSKTPVEYGTANGWDYVLYADKAIEATRTVSQTLSYYTTVGGFYGYYIPNIALPFTMADTRYYVGTTWSIGSGFSIPAGLLSITTTKFNAYAFSTAGGASQDVSLYLLLKGKIA